MRRTGTGALGALKFIIGEGGSYPSTILAGEPQKSNRARFIVERGATPREQNRHEGPVGNIYLLPHGF